MLTVPQAAKLAGVCQSTLRSWVQDGLLPHYRVGRKGRRGSIRIAEEDLNALLATFKVGAVPPPPALPKQSSFKHLRF